MHGPIARFSRPASRGSPPFHAGAAVGEQSRERARHQAVNWRRFRAQASRARSRHATGRARSLPQRPGSPEPASTQKAPFRYGTGGKPGTGITAPNGGSASVLPRSQASLSVTLKIEVARGPPPEGVERDRPVVGHRRSPREVLPLQRPAMDGCVVHDLARVRMQRSDVGPGHAVAQIDRLGSPSGSIRPTGPAVHIGGDPRVLPSGSRPRSVISLGLGAEACGRKPVGRGVFPPQAGCSRGPGLMHARPAAFAAGHVACFGGRFSASGVRGGAEASRRQMRSR